MFGRVTRNLHPPHHAGALTATINYYRALLPHVTYAPIPRVYDALRSRLNMPVLAMMADKDGALEPSLMDGLDEVCAAAICVSGCFATLSVHSQRHGGDRWIVRLSYMALFVHTKITAARACQSSMQIAEHSESHVIQNSSHWVQNDQPAVVNQLIDSFLTKYPPTRSRL